MRVHYAKLSHIDCVVLYHIMLRTLILILHYSALHDTGASRGAGQPLPRASGRGPGQHSLSPKGIRKGGTDQQKQQRSPSSHLQATGGNGETHGGGNEAHLLRRVSAVLSCPPCKESESETPVGRVLCAGLVLHSNVIACPRVAAGPVHICGARRRVATGVCSRRSA